MSKTVYYRQCRMRKETSLGHAEQTSWVPEQFAAVNKVLKLRDADGVWEDGWVVCQVGTAQRSQESLPDFHRDSKVHLRATGDSLPK